MSHARPHDSDDEGLDGWHSFHSGMQEKANMDSEDELDTPGAIEGSRRSTLHEVEGSMLDIDNGLLPRDKERKTAFFDHAAERQMSHSEAKQIYQRHQLAQQTIIELSQSLENSPTLEQAVVNSPIHGPASGTLGHAMEYKASAADGTTEHDNKYNLSTSPLNIAASGARESLKMPSSGLPNQIVTGHHSSQRIDQAALDSTTAQGLAHEPQSSLLGTGAMYGSGSGVGAATTGGFVGSDAQVTAELRAIYTKVQQTRDIRHKYIRLSLQESSDNPKNEPGWNIYPPYPEPTWDHIGERVSDENTTDIGNAGQEEEGIRMRDFKKPKRTRKMGHDIGDDFDFSDLLPLPDPSEMIFRMDDSGVYQVYEHEKAGESEQPIVHVPTIREFYMDLDTVLTISSDGPSKSFAFRRLQYLEGQFNLYALLHDYKEILDTKAVPHRDFYNVRKVDTHVHHSACMNQKHLLRFIKSKMKKCPDEVVLFRDGRHLTLKEVFESISLTAYDLSIDTLDMHVGLSSHRIWRTTNQLYIGSYRLFPPFRQVQPKVQPSWRISTPNNILEDGQLHSRPLPR